MAKQLGVLVPEVSVHLTNSPDSTVLVYLRRAAKQFCNDSGVWRHKLGTKAVTVPTDQDSETRYAVPSTDNEEADRDYTIPEHSYLSAITRAKLGRDYLEPEQYSYDIVNNELVIYPRTIMQAADLELWGRLEPTKEAPSIPDFLVERYSEGVCSYAIHEMMMMPNKDWSDPALAMQYRKKYEERVSEARVLVARGGTNKPITVEPIPFV